MTLYRSRNKNNMVTTSVAVLLANRLCNMSIIPSAYLFTIE